MTLNDPEPLDGLGQVPVCAKCGSERVLREALTCWNSSYGLWEVQSVQDRAQCEICGENATLRWTYPDDPPVEAIRTLNDMLRCYGRGNGQIVVTTGIQAQGEDFLRRAIQHMREFDGFSKENDVYGEHDFGAFDLEDQRLFFKVDYYDPSLTQGSENPANPEKTVRVLTLMLANEY